MIFRATGRLLLAFSGFTPALFAADPPTISKIDPVNASGSGQSVTLTITGQNLTGTDGPTLVFSAPEMITFGKFTLITPDKLVATIFTTEKAQGTVQISVNVGGKPSNSKDFDTGVAVSESTQSCVDKNGLNICNQLRWELDTNAATTTNQTSNAKTVPDLLFKLDYQFMSTTAPKAKNGKCQSTVKRGDFCPLDDKGFKTGMTGHMIFRTGLAQVSSGDKVQAASSDGKTPPPSSAPCPGVGSTQASTQTTGSPQGCTALVPHQAYVVEAGGTWGWEHGRGDGGTFIEGGLKWRGSGQIIVPSDQIIENQGNLYSDLKNVNLRNAIGIAEIVGRFRIANWGHDKSIFDSSTGRFKGNPDDLLVIEGGYQYNTGLDRLNLNDPLANTRHRFVGRFLANPEINPATHTRVTFGVEYNSGINGGPRDIKLLYGATLDPSALLRLASTK
jgi:hypothetical protein